MKKVLNTDNITNELQGASLFFTQRTPSPSPVEPEKPQVEIPTAPPAEPQVLKEPVKKVEKPKTEKVIKPQNDETVIPRHHDTTVSRHHETVVPSIHGVAIDLVRKAVKEFGKEAATHRFTEAEKKQVADLLYTYKTRGIKTSENEIARISINFVMEDFRVNGENSVLHKIIEALNE